MLKSNIKEAVSKRSIIHYLLAFIGLSIYGGQVCPLLATLNIAGIAKILFICTLIGYLLRTFLIAIIDNSHNPTTISRKQLVVEFLTFALMGFACAIYNQRHLGFPFASGGKVIVGYCAFGFFAAVDLALAKEYKTALKMENQNIGFNPEMHFFSMPKKFALFAILSTLILAIIVGLLLLRDLGIIFDDTISCTYTDSTQDLFIELGAVLITIIALIINTAISFSRNLSYFFKRQTTALENVTNGDYNRQIAVSTNDEFGIIAKHTNNMISSLKEKTEMLELTQDATILALASLAETRDNETGDHIKRTQLYVKALADNLKFKSGYREYLDEETIDLLFKSAPLHDVGKVGIPDKILLKPGKLDKAEFEIMKKHAKIGSDALEKAEKQLGSNSFLKIAREIAYTHHEKWDGSGYPQNLKGEDIPISGRLMALADVYDALISKRVYKEAFSHDTAKEIILEGRAVHFDPQIVDAFVEIDEIFRKIAKDFRN